MTTKYVYPETLLIKPTGTSWRHKSELDPDKVYEATLDSEYDGYANYRTPREYGTGTAVFEVRGDGSTSYGFVGTPVEKVSTTHIADLRTGDRVTVSKNGKQLLEGVVSYVGTFSVDIDLTNDGPSVSFGRNGGLVYETYREVQLEVAKPPTIDLLVPGTFVKYPEGSHSSGYFEVKDNLDVRRLDDADGRVIVRTSAHTRSVLAQAIDLGKARIIDNPHPKTSKLRAGTILDGPGGFCFVDSDEKIQWLHVSGEMGESCIRHHEWVESIESGTVVVLRGGIA